MKRSRRRTAIWIVSIMAVTLAGIVAPILAIGDSERVSFTATLYSDVIRFEADGVASLRVTIYDLSENELWSSGQVMGDFVDWDRTNAYGERLANGYYLYLAQGWDGSDELILNKTGKVVLLPGDQVELRAAPAATPEPGNLRSGGEGDDPIFGPNEYSHTGDWTVSGNLGVGTDSPAFAVHAYGAGSKGLTAQSTTYKATLDLKAADGYHTEFRFSEAGVQRGEIQWLATSDRLRFRTFGPDDIQFVTNIDQIGVHLDGANGNVGIGTANPTDQLTVEAGSGNAIAVYADGSRVAGAAVFRVESDGDVYADGTVYSARTDTGGADIAERINVSEWVEAGDVVEIDPEHIGFFRKAEGAYSRRVAGIISTSPGVILGNDVDPASGEWEDSRPVLAIAGRVPVKVSTENGPIGIGDLLVSSSTPGIAMRGDLDISFGAVVGRAMEGLKEGGGVIMAQVTLR